MGKILLFVKKIHSIQFPLIFSPHHNSFIIALVAAGRDTVGRDQVVEDMDTVAEGILGQMYLSSRKKSPSVSVRQSH